MMSGWNEPATKDFWHGMLAGIGVCFVMVAAYALSRALF